METQQPVKKSAKSEPTSMLAGLVQAFSALGIFVFYFGWISEEAYLKIFGLSTSSLDQPFYYFLVRGIQVNFPLRIESQPYSGQWQIWSWLIYLVLVILALAGNLSAKIRSHPLISSLIVMPVLIGLFVAMHFVGTMAGQERAAKILASPEQLRGVSYQYVSDSSMKAKRFSGYVLILTKDYLFVLQSRDLQEIDSPKREVGGQAVTTIVPIDRIEFLNTVGYQIK